MCEKVQELLVSQLFVYFSEGNPRAGSLGSGVHAVSLEDRTITSEFSNVQGKDNNCNSKIEVTVSIRLCMKNAAF